MLYVKRITESATLPTRCFQSAGYDLYSAYDYLIRANDRQLCKTDLIVVVPDGSYGRIASRSGLACEHCLDVGAGVIDGDYRGNVQVLLCNNSETDYVVKAGHKIAQLILEVFIAPEVCEITDMISPTGRGARGFGSTGLNNDREAQMARLVHENASLQKKVAALMVMVHEKDERLAEKIQEIARLEERLEALRQGGRGEGSN